MKAHVLRPYRDKETMAVHRAGETVEVSDSRFLELASAEFVEASEPPAEEPDHWEAEAEPPAEEPDHWEAEAEPPAEEPEQKSAEKMTVDELKAAIAAAGGFLPKNAKKDELMALYEAL